MACFQSYKTLSLLQRVVVYFGLGLGFGVFSTKGPPMAITGICGEKGNMDFPVRVRWT